MHLPFGHIFVGTLAGKIPIVANFSGGFHFDRTNAVTRMVTLTHSYAMQPYPAIPPRALAGSEDAHRNRCPLFLRPGRYRFLLPEAEAIEAAMKTLWVAAVSPVKSLAAAVRSVAGLNAAASAAEERLLSAADQAEQSLRKVDGVSDQITKATEKIGALIDSMQS